jgi:hypothetical protein
MHRLSPHLETENKRRKDLRGDMDNLINRSACKKLALRWGRDHRLGWQPTRVSKQFLDDLESKVRLIVQKAVDRHRSVGKAITDIL